MPDLTNLKPEARVRLKPLEECFKITPALQRSWVEMHHFWEYRTLTVKSLLAGRQFCVREDPDVDPWYFDMDWIAEILPAEEVQTGKCKHDTDGDGDCHLCVRDPLGCIEKRKQYNPETHVAIEKSVWKCNSGPRDGWEIYEPSTHRLVPVEHYVGPEEFAEFVFYHFGGAWKRPSDIHPGYGPRMAKLPPSVEHIVRRMAGESNAKYGPNEHPEPLPNAVVPREEFAELKRKAAEYDLLEAASQRFLSDAIPVSDPLTIEEVEDLAQEEMLIPELPTRVIYPPITPTPGPPELEGVSDEAMFAVTWLKRMHPFPNLTWKVFRASQIRGNHLGIKYHVGPILPPEVQGKDGGE